MAAASCVIIICAILTKGPHLGPVHDRSESKTRLGLDPVVLTCARRVALGLQAGDGNEAPPPRPVRTVAVEKGGRPINCPYRTDSGGKGGRSRFPYRRPDHRDTGVGDHVTGPGGGEARSAERIEPLRSARAALSAAKLGWSRSQSFDRQDTLLARLDDRASFDQAQQALRTAQAPVDDAKAQVEIAEDRVSYTQLKSGLTGTITRRRGIRRGGAAGQMVFTVARNSAGTLSSTFRRKCCALLPGDADVIIALTDDPVVTAKGRVRQVDPQADPVTRTFKVRVRSMIRRRPCGLAQP